MALLSHTGSFLFTSLLLEIDKNVMEHLIVTCLLLIPNRFKACNYRLKKIDRVAAVETRFDSDILNLGVNETADSEYRNRILSKQSNSAGPVKKVQRISSYFQT